MYAVFMLLIARLISSMLAGNFVKMNNVMPGVTSRVKTTTGVPSAGTTEVQTLTVGTVTSGQFQMEMDAIRATILWNDNAAAIQTKLRAMGNIGATGVTVTGTGPWTLTFGGGLDKKLLSTFVIVNNSLLNVATPVVPTIAKTTPGVNATARGSAKGTLLVNDATGIVYANTGTPAAPVWAAQA